MRLWGITIEFVGFILQSLVLRSIVLVWILKYQNWSILLAFEAKCLVHLLIHRWNSITFFLLQYQGWLGSRRIMLDKARPTLRILPAPIGPLFWRVNSWFFVTVREWMPLMLYRKCDLVQKCKTHGKTNSWTNMSRAWYLRYLEQIFITFQNSVIFRNDGWIK